MREKDLTARRRAAHTRNGPTKSVAVPCAFHHSLLSTAGWPALAQAMMHLDRSQMLSERQPGHHYQQPPSSTLSIADTIQP